MVATAMAALSACAPSDSETPGAETTASAVTPDGAVHLTPLAVSDPGLTPLLDRYQAEHPGVTVSLTFESPGSTHVLDEVEAGRDLADVVLLDGRLGALMSVPGLFIDLGDHGARERRADVLDWRLWWIG